MKSKISVELVTLCIFLSVILVAVIGGGEYIVHRHLTIIEKQMQEKEELQEENEFLLEEVVELREENQNLKKILLQLKRGVNLYSIPSFNLNLN